MTFVKKNYISNFFDFNKSDILKLFMLINIFAKLYFFLYFFELILSINLKVFIIQILLIYLN